jgi:secreted trypsin-like serine protease
VAGWGHKEYGGKKSTLRRVSVPILSNEECKTTTNYEPDRITPNMICAGSVGSDACQGDSGGPLFVNDAGQLRLIGIVSYGDGCGKAGYPGIYTRVSKYLTFICDELQADGKEDCVCANKNDARCHRCETTIDENIDDELDKIFG